MAQKILEIQKILREKQSDLRFNHTLGVQYTSVCLAMRHGADLKRAELAGLLHDCAKHMKPEKLLRISEKNHLEISPVQRANPFLLHGPVGALVAQKKYKVDDPEILDAIYWHTTGRPAMSLLEKIVFTADYIEPGRDKAPGLLELRRLSFENLDLAVYRILDQTLEYLKDKPQDIDDATQKTRDYYKALLGLQ